MLDVVIGELAAPAEGRGHNRAAPAEDATRTLLEWSLVTRDRAVEGLLEKLSAIASSKRPDAATARTAAAAILAARGRFDALDALASRSAARTSVVLGVQHGIHGRASREELGRPVPAVPRFYVSALSAMSSLAETKAQQKLVDETRASLQRQKQRLGKRGDWLAL